jgi:hypothetical protein
MRWRHVEGIGWTPVRRMLSSLTGSGRPRQRVSHCGAAIRLVGDAVLCAATFAIRIVGENREIYRQLASSFLVSELPT